LRLYRVAPGEPDHGTDHDRIKSIYGSLGAISAHFGWTLDYILWGVPWAVIQRILADQPRYNASSSNKERVSGQDVLDELRK